MFTLPGCSKTRMSSIGSGFETRTFLTLFPLQIITSSSITCQDLNQLNHHPFCTLCKDQQPNCFECRIFPRPKKQWRKNGCRKCRTTVKQKRPRPPRPHPCRRPLCPPIPPTKSSHLADQPWSNPKMV